MFNFGKLTQTLTAIACTLALSVTMIASAVGPAQAGIPVGAQRTIA